MKCSTLDRWLRENPGREIPEEILEHAVRCGECRRLLDEQQELDRVLRSLPPAEPPAFFEARLKGAVLSGAARPSPGWRPFLVPLAALLVAAGAAALFLSRAYGPTGRAPLPPGEIAAPSRPPVEIPPGPPKVGPTAQTRIYPVWPEDGDAVAGDDVSIMASLYPAPETGTVVSMTFNDQDVSDRLSAEGEIVSFSPGRIEPGRHVITITLRQAGAGTSTVTYSFFALEAQS